MGPILPDLQMPQVLDGCHLSVTPQLSSLTSVDIQMSVPGPVLNMQANYGWDGSVMDTRGQGTLEMAITSNALKFSEMSKALLYIC